MPNTDTPAAPQNTSEATSLAPVETFTLEEVQLAIWSFLEYGEQQYGKSQQGHFSGSGFAARAMRFHLDRLMSDNRKSEDEPNATDDRAVANTVEPVVRREGYQFCEKHQQEFRQYCCGCAVGLPSANASLDRPAASAGTVGGMVGCSVFLAYYHTGFNDDYPELLDVCDSEASAAAVIETHKQTRARECEYKDQAMWWMKVRAVRNANNITGGVAAP